MVKQALTCYSKYHKQTDQSCTVLSINTEVRRGCYAYALCRKDKCNWKLTILLFLIKSKFVCCSISTLSVQNKILFQNISLQYPETVEYLTKIVIKLGDCIAVVAEPCCGITFSFLFFFFFFFGGGVWFLLLVTTEVSHVGGLPPNHYPLPTILKVGGPVLKKSIVDEWGVCREISRNSQPNAEYYGILLFISV